MLVQVTLHLSLHVQVDLHASHYRIDLDGRQERLRETISGFTILQT